MTSPAVNLTSRHHPPVVAILPQPVTPPRVELERNRDKATQAVLAYFEAVLTGDTREQAINFSHLVGICCKAVQPYFVRDRHDTVIVSEVPLHADKDGKRTGRWNRREGSPHDATREFIQLWLLQFLSRYRGRSPNELIAAADRGEFRKLGYFCRWRLIDKIRADTAAKRRIPPQVSLGTPIVTDEGEGASLVDFFGTARPDAPSSLATANSFESYLACVSNACRQLLVNRVELEKLDVFDGLSAMLENAEDIQNRTARQYGARVVRSIARIRGVSVQSARRYVRKFVAAMVAEQGNSAVRAVVLELDSAPPAYKFIPSAPVQSVENASARLRFPRIGRYHY